MKRYLLFILSVILLSGAIVRGESAPSKLASRKLPNFSAFQPTAGVEVSGRVFHDIDGLSDNRIHTNGTVNGNGGTNTSANGLGGLYAILYNRSNVVEASVSINSQGFYTFSNVQPGEYAVSINSYSGVVGEQIHVHTITPGWESTGERIGIGTGTDGTIDGKSDFFTITGSSQFDVNFGIRVVPTPAESCFTDNPYMPVDDGHYVVVNGVTITPIARSGSVEEGSQGVFGCVNASNFTSYALWGGYDRANRQNHAPADANSDWSITYSFSQPVNNLRILVGSMGGLYDETLIVKVDGEAATIVAEESCHTAIVGNTITGGASAPYPNGSGGGVFVLSGLTPFTTLTFSGPGGANGMTIEFCSRSIVAAPETYNVCGSVLLDTDGLKDGNIHTSDGNPTFPTNAGGVYLNLINSAGEVVATRQPSWNGANYTPYCFNNVAPGSYHVQISTIEGVPGQAAPVTGLPSGWVSTGEINGNGAGTDGVIPGPGRDGESAVFSVSGNVSNIDFGVQQLPTPSGSTAPTVPNPGGTIQSANAADLFSGTDPNGGIITAIRITEIPSTATSIAIDGVVYTTIAAIDAAYPNGIPTNAAGQPTVTITVDPAEPTGPTVVTIPFKVIDNAGFESSTASTVTLPFDSSLPVSLISFDAREEAGTVQLHWTTSFESNSRGFEVERGADAKSFIPIAFVSSRSENGESRRSLSYSFVDTELPQDGIFYYRLKMIDRDDTFSYSRILSVTTEIRNNLTLYPNPASELIFLKNEDLSRVKQVQIYNATGVQVVSKRTDLSHGIRISHLVSGIYMLAIEKVDGSVTYSRLAVVR